MLTQSLHNWQPLLHFGNILTVFGGSKIWGQYPAAVGMRTPEVDVYGGQRNESSRCNDDDDNSVI